MADVITGHTELSATKAAIIAAVVAKELAFSAKLVPTITDYSSWAAPGARSVAIPKTGSLTVVDRASGSPGDASVLTMSSDIITLDQAAYVAWLVDSQDLIQSKIEVQAEYAKRAASAHGRFVDSNLLALLEAGAPATTTAGAITKDIVLEMRKTLITNFADPSQLFLAVGPDSEALLLNIAEFVRSDSYGSLPTSLQTGVIGRLYGVNVVVHAGIAANRFYMYEKSGVYIAFQQGAMMSEQMANEFGSQAKRVAMDQLFGSRLGQAGLYVKDNN
jgi:hypothetical protein